MLMHNTQPADILAFIVKLLKIHMQPYLYSPAPAGISKDIFFTDRFLTTTGKQTNYYQTLTHHIVHKYHTFYDYTQIEIL